MLNIPERLVNAHSNIAHKLCLILPYPCLKFLLGAAYLNTALETVKME
jgi:hypothetical protein